MKVEEQKSNKHCVEIRCLQTTVKTYPLFNKHCSRYKRNPISLHIPEISAYIQTPMFKKKDHMEILKRVDWMHKHLAVLRCELHSHAAPDNCSLRTALVKKQNKKKPWTFDLIMSGNILTYMWVMSPGKTSQLPAFFLINKQWNIMWGHSTMVWQQGFVSLKLRSLCVRIPQKDIWHPCMFWKGHLRRKFTIIHCMSYSKKVEYE